MAKIDKMFALATLESCGVLEIVDVDTYPSTVMLALHAEGKLNRYRQPKNPNGSYARYYFHYLKKMIDRG